jgi:hypothetical protein
MIPDATTGGWSEIHLHLLVRMVQLAPAAREVAISAPPTAATT